MATNEDDIPEEDTPADEAEERQRERLTDWGGDTIRVVEPGERLIDWGAVEPPESER